MLFDNSLGFLVKSTELLSVWNANGSTLIGDHQQAVARMEPLYMYVVIAPLTSPLIHCTLISIEFTTLLWLPRLPCLPRASFTQFEPC